MEIKPGYKQTEIGVIPEDWEVDYIGNQLSINTGKRNTQDSNVTGEYPFFVRSQVVERINSYSFDGEAVLTAGDGVGTGKVVHYINGRFDYHQRVYCLSGFSQKLDGYYFYLFFKNRFLARIQQFTAKTSVDSVRLEMISKMPVALPPLSEQKHIAVVMQDIDSLITSLEKLIEKKKLIKQGVMQELLTWKRRLSGLTGIVRSYQFDQIFNRIPSKKHQISTKDYSSSGLYPVIDQGQSSIAGYSDNVEKVYRCSKNGVIVFGDHTREFKYVDFDFIVGADGTQILQTKSGFCAQYLYFYMLNIDIPNTGYNRHFKYLSQVPYHIPDLNEQQQIAEILMYESGEITNLEKLMSKYRNLKQAMMQELLTGRIRLI